MRERCLVNFIYRSIWINTTTIRFTMKMIGCIAEVDGYLETIYSPIFSTPQTDSTKECISSVPVQVHHMVDFRSINIRHDYKFQQNYYTIWRLSLWDLVICLNMDLFVHLSQLDQHKIYTYHIHLKFSVILLWHQASFYW